MADMVKEILGKPIQLADQVIKAAGQASSSKLECGELKAKTEKLAQLLRQAARASSDLYERPTRRIIDETVQVLDKALSLVLKCRANGLMKRVFTIIPIAGFRKMLAQLDNSANEPILCLIWEHIAILYTGSLEDRAEAAAALVSLARDNERYGKLIIEEGGVVPLLKLMKEGRVEGQENAARAIGLLGRDPESIEQMIHAGACSVFAKVLKEGPMKVQAEVAWAVAELTANYPKCQDLFAQHNIIRLLVGHLAFETIQEHSKYAITTNKATSIHAVVMASNNSNATALNKGGTDHDDDRHTQIPRPVGNQNPNQMQKVVTNTMAMNSQSKLSQRLNNGANQTNHVNSENAKHNHQHHHHTYSGHGIKGRELEDPATKTEMKSMAARALWHLAKGNSHICRNITESRALLCFAVLLEQGIGEVKLHSAMALMEITAVAEQDTELRRFRAPYPCVKAIGNLARTFKATETRMISPLVRLLDEREAEISREASIALTKFACTDNYLHTDHCKAIISAGGAKHLVQLVYFGEQIVQISALVLLCYIALHVPDSEELAMAQVLTVLEWASKQGWFMVQDETVESLLDEAKKGLKLYQSKA
ncbi:hypothetical protein CK203_006015 [Vitis vinifera]|uniref:DUF7792 domain-containing protein n=1 Tax=Vitis vinifera TaxID=29760 RepID=A0A438K5S7_VITVI|nr:hypothetical protein CK203_006015 [Vitis vinifera]